MKHRICQVEIAISEREKALEFYEKVFSWTEAPVSIHGYIILQVDKDSEYGVSLKLQKKIKVNDPKKISVLLYFAVSNLNESLKLVEEAGGRIFSSEKKIPAYGSLAIIKDPDGNAFGLFEKES